MRHSFLARQLVTLTRMLLKKRVGLALNVGFWLGVIVCFATAPAAIANSVPIQFETTSQADSPFAIADFDGDAQPDIAIVQLGKITASDTQYWIHFQLSSGGRQWIRLTAPVGGLRIASRDVNGDTFVDLIVSTVLYEVPVAVLLNDGRGNFTVRDPRTFPTVMAPPGTALASTVQNRAETTAALVSRSSPTHCEVIRGSTCPGHKCQSGRTLASPLRNLVLAGLILGRAPPVVLYV
jgi:hypothetical protein